MNFLEHKKNTYSQNGEDGILEAIFGVIGFESKLCCEFGAWDGTHFSNTKNLIEKYGLTGVMIEGNKSKFIRLVETYKNRSNVICINAFVDSGLNSVENLMLNNGISVSAFNSMDLLSVDIDGLDYEIFQNLNFKPRVIVIEVNAGHDPEATEPVPLSISKDIVGQPLSLFTELAKQKGYGLICYNGNAFYVLEDIIRKFGLQVLDNTTAYESFLQHLSFQEKKWLTLVNKGKVVPFYSFNNPRLEPHYLGVTMPSTPIKERIKRVKKKLFK